MLIRAIVTLSFHFSTCVLECIWDMTKQYSELFYYTCFKGSFSLIGTIYYQLTPLEKKKILVGGGWRSISPDILLYHKNYVNLSSGE